MRKIIINLFLTILVAGLLVSCGVPGTSNQTLNGNEQYLPEELKGLKVYSICTSEGYINVALFNGNVNSIMQQSGKTQVNTILLNNSNNKIIPIDKIILENDSIVVASKY